MFRQPQVCSSAARLGSPCCCRVQRSIPQAYAMVFGLGNHHKEEESAYNSFYEGGDGGQDYDGNKLHEGIAGAAAYYAMKKYEERREAEGHNDHSFAREMLAAVTGAEVDKLAEGRGLDYEAKERAKDSARERANRMYETSYVEGYAPEPPGGTAAARAYGPNAGDYTSASDYVNQSYEGYRGPESDRAYKPERAHSFGAEQGFGGSGGEYAGYNRSNEMQGTRGGGGGGGYAEGVGYRGGYDEMGYGGNQGVDPSMNDYSGDGIVVPPSTMDARYATYPGQRERYGRGGMGDI